MRVEFNRETHTFNFELTRPDFPLSEGEYIPEHLEEMLEAIKEDLQNEENISGLYLEFPIENMPRAEELDNIERHPSLLYFAISEKEEKTTMALLLLFEKPKKGRRARFKKRFHKRASLVENINVNVMIQTKMTRTLH